MADDRPIPWEDPKKPDEALTGNRRAKPRCKIHPVNESTGFCTSCGSPFCPACRTNALGRNICTNCFESTKELEKRHEEEKKKLKSQLRQQFVKTKWKLRGPIGAVVGFVQKVRRTGGMPLKRIVAQGLNIPVVLALSIVVWISADQFLPDTAAWKQTWLWYGQPFGLLWGSFLYFFPAWGLFGTDLGKWSLGLELKSSKGKRLGLWRAFWRWVGMVAMLSWLAWGFVMLTWTSWLLEMAGKMATTKLALILWGCSGFVSLCVWLMVLLMFLGRQNRHLADILGQCMVKEREGEKAEETELAEV